MAFIKKTSTIIHSLEFICNSCLSSLSVSTCKFDLDCRYVDVQGIICKNFNTAPKKCKSKYVLTFTLKDTSTSDFFSLQDRAQCQVLMFGTNLDWFPPLECVGDIIYLRHVEFRVTKGNNLEL